MIDAPLSFSGQEKLVVENIGFIAILLCILTAGVVSRRIQGTIITLPIVYVALGLLVGSQGLGLVQMRLDNELLRIIAELTLVLVLASDAYRISLRLLRRDHILPARLLGIGLLLTMLFGTLIAYLIFGELGFWGAAVLAVILAPTDASLGQPVVTNPSVPVRIRQTLNIESGLNDGIAMPFLVLAISLAIAADEKLAPIRFIISGLIEIGIAVAVGIAVGWSGAKLLGWGQKSGWISTNFRKAMGVALILLAYAVAEALGGNGFIAAFVMGMVRGHVARHTDEDIHRHIEVEVSLLILLTFLLYGAVLLPRTIPHIDGMMVLYALVSLTFIRMIPVAVSLLGAGTKPITTGFIGWFGPRGTASILYIFTVLEVEDLIIGAGLIYDVTMITVLLSVILHGVTAAPLAKRYGKRIQLLGEEQPETMEIDGATELPLRTNT
jgi:NhaP-type Na+/H+ or K+/H+ antiporter